jgi:hypothetical protein
MSPGQWDAEPWYVQKAYLEGLEAEGIFEFREAGPEPGEMGLEGPAVREGVDAGVGVIDLTAMREELEAQRRKRDSGR